MKSLLFSLFFLFVTLVGNAQIIEIPDASFKSELVGDLCVDTDGDGTLDSSVDTNNDGEIQITEAESVTSMWLFNNNATTLEGLQFFTNLERLTLYFLLDLESLDVTPLTNLVHLEIEDCLNFESLNASGLTNLETVICQGGGLNAIDLNGCINLKTLNISNSYGITTLDLSDFTNLEYLDVNQSQLTNLNLNGLINLEHLDVSMNFQLPLDLDGLTNLEYLDCSSTQSFSLDVSGLANLTTLICPNNALSNLDLSQNFNLTTLDVSDNWELESLTIKNGVAENINIEGIFNLEFICADDDEIATVQSLVDNLSYINCVVNSYCSFNPGGITYAIEGENVLDIDANGCDINDPQFPNMMFNITSVANSGSFIADASGNYSFEILEGMHTIEPQFENSDYFSVSPSSVSVNFPTDASPFYKDFCITPIGVYKDIELSIFPLTSARPGFEASYRIIYKNIGNSMIDFGQIILTNDFDLMTEVEFLPSWDSFTFVDQAWHFNYSDLSPFESRTIDFTMEINTPTDAIPVNGGDILTFEVNHFIEYDDISANKVVTLNQTVVNSLDPNDIKCLEGETILPEDVGKYVHYLIRFENLGTANAVNVVVKNTIDATKFDISTLVPISGSHDYFTRINATNDVEFIFENIQLPFDDANNDGYVLYKIKTLESLVLGDVFSNQAEIYFDFNAPIITNNYSTEVAEDNLGTSDFNLSTIKVYPNPVSDVLTIETSFTLSKISVYDIEGRKVLEVLQVNTNQIDLSALRTGIYFVKVFSESNTETLKVIKH